jgi:sialate O-acetylesterase
MNARRLFLYTLTLTVAAAVASPAVAEVTPNPLFSDNAVLQRDMKIPVWGIAADGENVTVKFAGQEVSTTAKGGNWRVDLKPIKAGGPFEMTIGGTNTIILKNILVGEVWIASGQSNMQWTVKLSDKPEETIAASANPQIRLLTVTRRATPEPQTNIPLDNKWVECGPNTVGEFSAVAYHFGADLAKHLKVPIGLISTNYGGTPAEAWTSKEAIAADPTLKAYHGVAANDKSSSPSGLYNAMINPLIPYGIRGAIWYQGESNAGRAFEYRTLFTTMIKDWRTRWGEGDFPFLLVQLAPFTAIKPEPGDSDWAELREAQYLATKNLPNVGMAVITDLGDEKDIHPKWKQPVGHRLALAARAMVHGEDVEHCGPILASKTIEGDKVILTFDHAKGGLAAKEGALTGFTIAGDDRKFVRAMAEIDGNKIVVSSPDVKKPVAVRFGWANFPVVNLFNKADLPATPFRTDDFPGVTQPK